MYVLVRCCIFFSAFSSIYTNGVDVDFIQTSRKFTADLYRTIANRYRDNFVFSPFSLQILLALTCEGARDETRQQLINGMFLQNSTDMVRNAYKSISENNDHNFGVDLINSNAIFADLDVSLNPSFQQIALDAYRAEFQNLNFADNVASADSINAWIDSQTNHKITNLMTSDDVMFANLLLINGIYFKASWDKQFTEEKNMRKFYNYGREPSKVPFMRMIGSYNCYTDNELGANFIELPYKGENLSMIIILPVSKDGLEIIEKNIFRFGEIPHWDEKSVDLTLPKFNVETAYHFADILKVLGIRKIFSPQAQLENLSENNLYITDIVQKAFINVTEAGTEAAAITVDIVGRFAERTFDIDHPFIFYIQKNGVILFTGRVNNIKNV
ncbi:antichymotrypsin-2-like [Diorhabda carinulata]|uniref:antichymotrypsin-2-like n=1 Tax=Diorhabda carinulata TaxID=1163345 RepID=UPI0025A01124|nr:antichymotrypsin-2-like [Diorhabda carinulata]